MSSPESPLDDHLDPDPDDPVTLHQLHDEIVAGASEARRGERRTLEVLKNFRSVLDALSATVNDTHKAVRAFPSGAAAGPAQDGGPPREWALALIELADRIARVGEGFARPPATASNWWPGSRKATAIWRDAWAMQTDALGILASHMEVLLKQAGLERLAVVGMPFDPATMTAVESVAIADHADHTVLAELLPGWSHAVGGHLLRPAQVRVSRLPTN
jgi:hypothetical protein